MDEDYLCIVCDKQYLINRTKKGKVAMYYSPSRTGSRESRTGSRETSQQHGVAGSQQVQNQASGSASISGTHQPRAGVLRPGGAAPSADVNKRVNELMSAIARAVGQSATGSASATLLEAMDNLGSGVNHWQTVARTDGNNQTVKANIDDFVAKVCSSVDDEDLIGGITRFTSELHDIIDASKQSLMRPVATTMPLQSK